MPVNFEKTGEHAQEKLQMFASSTSKVAISANATERTPKQSRALRLEAKNGGARLAPELALNSPAHAVRKKEACNFLIFSIFRDQDILIKLSYNF